MVQFLQRMETIRLNHEHKYICRCMCEDEEGHSRCMCEATFFINVT
jgi:hypothetical protein